MPLLDLDVSWSISLFCTSLRYQLFPPDKHTTLVNLHASMLQKCKVDIGAGSNSNDQRHAWGRGAAVLLKPEVAYAERPEHDELQPPWRNGALMRSTSQIGIQT